MGTSGGAWAATNAALEHPGLVERIVADSFDGRTLAENFAENLVKERSSAKKDKQAAGGYGWCQGDEWEEASYGEQRGRNGAERFSEGI